jgi:16S rRNA (guanine1516-N2)-methyltransferase
LVALARIRLLVLIGLVSSSPSGSDVEARELADRFGLSFEPRKDRLVEELLQLSTGAPLLLLGRLSADLFTRTKTGSIQSQRASLGMALLRFSRALDGERDNLVRVASLLPGDRVIDATLGLGADALIAAHTTRARVLAFEQSPIIAAFTQAALRRPTGAPDLRKAALEAGERIVIRAGNHQDLLAAEADKSAEVILFDPMFQAPVESQPVFDVIRAHAERSKLSDDSLAQARRVATRGILIKDSPRGSELKRLKLEPLHSRRVLFGWMSAVEKL